MISKQDKISYLKMALLGIVSIPIIIFVLILIAGRMDYWQGWVFGAFTTAGAMSKVVFMRDKLGLARERFKPGSGTKWWDKIFWVLFVPTFIAIVLIGALDGGRYHWTIMEIPIYVYIIAYVIQALAYALTFLAMRENKFFSSTVRIQKDRGQTVIQTGPYSHVRHPGYVAGLLIGPTVAIVLGSLWALIPAALMSIILVVRTYLEDKTLQKELKGYKQYTKKVRYRLVPGLW